MYHTAVGRDVHLLSADIENDVFDALYPLAPLVVNDGDVLF